MPAQVLLKKRGVNKLYKRLRDIGLRKITKNEKKKLWRRLGLSAPRPQEFDEVGLIYSANGMNVIVWTTVDEDTKVMAQSDSAWVLITKGDTLIFSAPRLQF